MKVGDKVKIIGDAFKSAPQGAEGKITLVRWGLYFVRVPDAPWNDWPFYKEELEVIPEESDDLAKETSQ